MFRPNKLVVAVAATTLVGVSVVGYKWLSNRFTRCALDDKVIDFLDASEVDRLAEECLADVVLDDSNLIVDPAMIETARNIGLSTSLSVVCTEQTIVFGDVVVAIDEPQLSVVAGSVDSEPSVQGPQEIVPSVGSGSAIANMTPELQVRESRKVVKDCRTIYARRVFDACKAKFGTPKNTEANYRAVWRFAQTQMKDHGVRPAHQAELIPEIVANVFVPTLEELVAKRNVGVMKKMVDGRFEEQLSTWERWSRRMTRVFTRA